VLAPHGTTLHHTAPRCCSNTLQHTLQRCHGWMRLGSIGGRAHTATHCNTLQYTARCNALYSTLYTLQHTSTRCNTLLHTATHCNTLQHTAIHCNTLQHAATHCNTLPHSAAPSHVHEAWLGRRESAQVREADGYGCVCTRAI